jgi:HAE1 family hydrophobic/amphiphilic exporter-1
MTLSDVAIRRPVFTSMLAVCLLVLGFLGYKRLGTDLYPDVSIPFCMVTTVYPGAGPQDIETQVSRPIEDAAAGIPGIDRVFSESRENVSVVFVQFKLSVPLAEAVQQVRDKVGIAQALLPHEARPPVIAQFDISAQPILVFSASSTADPLALHDLLDDKIRPRLEQLEGVAAARVLGGSVREVAVDLFPDRLTALNLTPDAVLQRIRAEHLDLPAGRYTSGPGEVGVRVAGEFKNVDKLRQMVVATAPDGSQVHLSDIALVRETAAEARTLVRTNGRDAVAMEVIKQSGSNTVQVASVVKAELARLHEQHGDRFRADLLIDQSSDIEANAHEVWIAIYFGGAMAILIILLFLMDWRGTLISALALPTSVVGTLFFMWYAGFSLNQLTLLGLSLAIGLLIDDAVVVRESITRRLEAGADPVEAASLGTQEIALAVMATTFTLCAVFVPVAFMQGIVGQFFRQFGLTITAAVLISLFVAFTLDPMLSARFARAGGHSHVRHPVVVRLEAFFGATDRLYAVSLAWVLAHRKTTMLAAALIFFGSLVVASRLGTDFVGNEDRGQLLVSLEFPPGTRIGTTSARSAVAEAEVARLPGVTTVYAVVGPQEQVEKVTWRVTTVDKQARSQSIDYYKQEVRRILAKVPQARFSVANPPALEGLGDWPPIWMQVTGPEFDGLRREANVVAEALRSIPGTADVQVKDNPGKPELQVRIDREAASRIDLPAGAIAMQVRLATQGDVAGKIRQGRRESEIRVRLAIEGRESAEALQRMWIWGPRGPVTLSQVATLVPAEGPAMVQHELRERTIGVTSELAPGADLGSVVRALHEKLDGRQLEPGYAYIWNGQQRDMKDMLESIGMALGLALVFIFMVLASQFESLVHPFTIMLSLPLALVGAVLGLGVTGYPMAMGANIGIILLMGLVTKNAILLVDGALQRLAEGGTAGEAMLYAGPRRLRPILMTSAAMVLGMLPTALGRGTGSEFRAPMAIGVIGGVLTSTLLTLWVVPVVFVWFERLRGIRLFAARRASGRASAHAVRGLGSSAGSVP